MTPEQIIVDLRNRINPEYYEIKGTESYERRICADAIESLLDQAALLRTQRDYILSAAQRTLDENGHLADGDNCTLIVLKRAVETLTECREETGKGE